VRRVLVVEQGEPIAQLLRATLPAGDWVVYGAADAVDATNLLRDKAFDLIIVDLRLPDDGALDVVRVLHDNDVIASVLLLANRDDVHAAFRGLDGEPCSPVP
jgi:DNA-binding response OmpR family regulator